MHTIQLIGSAEFSALKEEWNGLLSRSASDNVFLRWEWLHTWWQIFKQNRQLLILSIQRDGKRVGLAPFYIEQSGKLGLRKLRFCSDELSPDYLDVIAERGEEAGVVRTLWDYLRANPLWDLIVWDHLREDSILLSAPVKSADDTYKMRGAHTCPYIKITGSKDDYYEAHPDIQFRRKRKLLFNKHAVTHHVIKDEIELEQHINTLFVLHEKRAEEKKIQTSLASAEIKHFHLELSRLFLRENILNFQFLYHGNTAISALYAFNYKNKVYFFQSGMDPEWGKCSAGSVLINLAVEQAFEGGLDEFDFLKGEERYKTLWATAVRQELEVSLYNQTWRGRLWHTLLGLRATLGSVKHAVKDTLTWRRPEAARQGSTA